MDHADGFPSPSQEAWRYFDLETLRRIETAFKGVTGPAPDAARLLADVHVYQARHGGRHFVLVDGFSLTANGLDAGGAARSSVLPPSETVNLNEQDHFAATNQRRSRETLHLTVPAGGHETETLHVWFWASERSGSFTFYPRLVLEAEKDSFCHVVLHTGSPWGPYFMNAVVEVSAADGAQMEIVSLQDAAPDAVEFTAWRVAAAGSARVRLTEIMTGEGLVRNDVRVSLDGPGASVTLGGLSVLSGAAGSHNHSVVTHAAPGTTSRQLFKDILSGASRSEYSGLVHVLRGAPGSDSNQLCRNLLLSDEARAHSRPQLKIDTDDVKCSHGSATGQLPANELFYLQSRGLSHEQARAILIEGFAEEVVLTLPESLRQEAHERVRHELERVAGLQPEEALR